MNPTENALNEIEANPHKITKDQLYSLLVLRGYTQEEAEFESDFLSSNCSIYA